MGFRGLRRQSGRGRAAGRVDRSGQVAIADGDCGARGVDCGPGDLAGGFRHRGKDHACFIDTASVGEAQGERRDPEPRRRRILGRVVMQPSDHVEEFG